MKLHRSINEEIREFVDMDHRWRGSDRGLIWCWERGRQMRNENPDLATRANNGELILLGWRGGVEPGVKLKSKKGTLNYLAQWQGLRGENLNIDISKEQELVCSKTGMRVVYTTDYRKYANK